jgi:hypothetical protein
MRYRGQRRASACGRRPQAVRRRSNDRLRLLRCRRDGCCTVLHQDVVRDRKLLRRRPHLTGCRRLPEGGPSLGLACQGDTPAHRSPADHDSGRRSWRDHRTTGAGHVRPSAIRCRGRRLHRPACAVESRRALRRSTRMVRAVEGQGWWSWRPRLVVRCQSSRFPRRTRPTAVTETCINRYSHVGGEYSFASASSSRSTLSVHPAPRVREQGGRDLRNRRYAQFRRSSCRTCPRPSGS